MVEAQWPPPVTKSAFVSVGSLLGLIAASREHLIRLNELLRWQLTLPGVLPERLFSHCKSVDDFESLLDSIRNTCLKKCVQTNIFSSAEYMDKSLDEVVERVADAFRRQLEFDFGSRLITHALTPEQKVAFSLCMLELSETFVTTARGEFRVDGPALSQQILETIRVKFHHDLDMPDLWSAIARSDYASNIDIANTLNHHTPQARRNNWTAMDVGEKKNTLLSAIRKWIEQCQQRRYDR